MPLCAWPSPWRTIGLPDRWPDLRPLDLAIIAAYLLGLAGIGLYFSRRQKTTESYFIANHSIPGWAMGLSLLATIITSITFIAYPGAAYAGDWSLLVPGFMFVALLAVAGFIFIPFFRNVVHMSAYEYFGQRFGKSVRVYASFTFAVGHLSKMAFVFYLLGLTLSGMTGWPLGRVVAITAAVTIFYTLFGGIEAVVWSDVIQGFILWAGILVSIGFLLFLPTQGPHAVLADAWHAGKMSLGSTALRFDKPTLLVLCIYGLFFYIQKYTADQTVVQRYLLAPTDRAALRGVALGASLCIPVWTAFMLIGSLLWSFYRLTGEKLPATITKVDQIFPYFLNTHIPSGLSGLFVAALMGSAMAMLASDMNCLGVIGTQDFYQLARPKSTDKERLRVGRIVVVAGGLAASGFAMLLAHAGGSALSVYYTVNAIAAGGLAGLFLLAFLMRRATPAGAIAGVAANIAFTLWATLSHGSSHAFRFRWHEYMIGAVGHVILVAVGVAVSLLSPSSGVRCADLTLWGWLSRRRSTPPAASSTHLNTDKIPHHLETL